VVVYALRLKAVVFWVFGVPRAFRVRKYSLDWVHEMQIQFLGATGTVTGSKYLVHDGSTRVLIDCGLFQGYKQLRLRNWARFPVPVESIDAIVLTHAHIDHSGYLPLLAKNGYRGKVYCSRASAELCRILLPDAGHLQEEEARYADHKGFSKHKPALPLFTQQDAERALARLHPVDFGAEVQIADGVSFRLRPAGHILGAASVLLRSHERTIAFSGDVGRPDDPIMCPATPIEKADWLVVESTYGDRLHGDSDPEKEMAAVINRAYERGGAVIIPAFAVGRSQSLLFYISRLKSQRAIPDIPVFLNSPMAVNVTRLYEEHHAEHRLTLEQSEQMCRVAQFVNATEASKALNRRTGPMIIVSASGMATGGRVLHHLAAFCPDPRNLVLFAGFQAGGTRGAAMVQGAKTIKIHGNQVPVRAEVVQLASVSAHADSSQLIGWMQGFRSPPQRVFVTHGEPGAADAFRRRIAEELGWQAQVPDYLESVDLEQAGARR
jgi:metallo-beta-lactamase family protein